MERKLFCLLLCCMSMHMAVAQQLKPTAHYMAMSTVSQAAKDYHAGTMQAGNNELTYSIADSMRTFNDDARPFYIFLVSKMLMTADRELSQALGKRCRAFLQTHPNDVIGLLFSRSVKPVYKYQWARAIALDITGGCAGTPAQCFKASRVGALQRCAEFNKEHLELIYNEVRNNLRLHH